MPQWKRKTAPFDIVELIGGLGLGGHQKIQTVKDPYDPNEPVRLYETEDFQRDYEPVLPKVDPSGLERASLRPRAAGAVDPSGPPVLDEIDPTPTPAMVALNDLRGKVIEVRAVVDVIRLEVAKISATISAAAAAAKLTPPPAPAPSSPPPPPAPAEPTGS